MLRPPASGRQTNLHWWQPADLPGATLFRAEHLQQRFARHSHEEYALGVITNGVLGFDYRGQHVLAGAGEINLVVPGETHTGQPAAGEDWSYRMFYLQPALLQEVTRQLGTDNSDLPFFRAGVIRDGNLAGAIAGLHADLDRQAISSLEAQSRLLAVLATWIRAHGDDEHRSAPRVPAHASGMARVRDYLDECWDRKPALNELARMVELSPYQLLRAFIRHYGLPPHAYLVQRQVREAKRLLDSGMPIAAAACASGFADQSHLHRHFKRTWGITPGQYRNFVQESGRRRH